MSLRRKDFDVFFAEVEHWTEEESEEQTWKQTRSTVNQNHDDVGSATRG